MNGSFFLKTLCSLQYIFTNRYAFHWNLVPKVFWIKGLAGMLNVTRVYKCLAFSHGNVYAQIEHDLRSSDAD